MDKEIVAEKLENVLARVAVVGLGYVGRPLAACIHGAGFAVEGIDSFMEEAPPELSILERFHFHRDYGAVRECDVIVICVPTPLTEDETPDLSHLEDATDNISAQLAGAKAGEIGPKLVILESTSYPGTTREVLVPRLEASGLVPGSDLFVAYAPERIDPGPAGSSRYSYDEIPRVIGGYDSASGDLATAFYRKLGCRVHRVSAPEMAEMSKLLENVFRAVNIALVNEISLLCREMGIDIWEVVEAAATKPFGFMPFRPGPGMGGHCIPVDPFYLAWRARQYDFNPAFIELAGKINRDMPHHVVVWIEEALAERGGSIEGSRVMVVGVAYKEDVADTRESPALKVIGLLADSGADVTYHDSHVDSIEVDGRRHFSIDMTREALERADCVVILCAHSDLDRELIKSIDVPVVDVRNALGRSGR